MGNAQSQALPLRTETVHPHARGERRIATSSAAENVGSSPRTWGTHHHVAQRHRQHRFIPTHVGNANSANVLSACTAVHPHARGERGAVAHAKIARCGSSPRTWGTRLRRAAVQWIRWFIPTHVGNAHLTASTPVLRAVHPHARGERPALTRANIEATGSSPRTWGTLGDLISRVGGQRFIPTHVGNAAPRPRPGAGWPVHPHARGERRRSELASTNDRGSSPRTWGTRLAGAVPNLARRFIPTHVGNAPRSQALHSAATVHPHARGERRRRRLCKH